MDPSSPLKHALIYPSPSPPTVCQGCISSLWQSLNFIWAAEKPWITTSVLGGLGGEGVIVGFLNGIHWSEGNLVYRFAFHSLVLYVWLRKGLHTWTLYVFFPATAIVIKRNIWTLPDLTLMTLKQTHFEWTDLSSYLDRSQASSLFTTSSALCHLYALSAMSLHCF